MSDSHRLHFGKYRGTVAANLDEHKLGRLKVLVPAVQGDNPVWAFPCSPFAGPELGLFFIPPVGANVWVEYEGGNPDSPIWVGGFWDETGPPPEEALTEAYPLIRVLKTDGVTLWIDDADGGLHLTIGAPLEPPVTIVAGPSGLTVTVEQSTATVAEGQITLSVDDTATLALSDSATLGLAATSLALSEDGASLTSDANASITGEAISVTGSFSVNDGALSVA